jgi:hypothetical protein
MLSTRSESYQLYDFRKDPKREMRYDEIRKTELNHDPPNLNDHSILEKSITKNYSLVQNPLR